MISVMETARRWYCAVSRFAGQFVSFRRFGNSWSKTAPCYRRRWLLLPGLGSAAAKSIVDSRIVRPFSSQGDLRLRGHVSKSIIELLRQQGCLDSPPESDQLRLFG